MPVLQNTRWERFAQGLATGLTQEKAYVAAGFSPNGASPSAARLLGKASVAARVKELKSAIAEWVHSVAVVDKRARLSGYQERLDLMNNVIKERQVDPCNQLAAGAKTGLMARTVKMIGGGDNAVQVEEFAFDVGLMREMRELEKQIAIEQGEWVERKESTHEGPGVQVNVQVRQDLISLGPEFAEEYLAMCRRFMPPASPDSGTKSAAD